MVMLAGIWNGGSDLRGWMASEKLDGIRAYWNGKTLKTRNGNIIHAPKWFLDCLHRDIHMDGELWTGRNEFEKVSSIVRRKVPTDEWFNVKYMVFDVPSVKGPFSERATVGAIVCRELPLVWVRQTVVKNNNHIKTLLTIAIAKGGEGLMLRDPKSKYEDRRTKSLLKVKPFRDLEAKCIGVKEGTGKYTGQIGALICRLNNGRTFSVGSGLTDHDRKMAHSHFLRKTITVSYQQLTNHGAPRHPVFLRIRGRE